ncbi:glycerate kinase [Candidatus Poribacteria bacterium]|nr:glycerate kinase [Candidatus Poribacteria bacterium]
MKLNELRQAAREIVSAALKSVDPETLIHRMVRLEDGRLAIGANSVDLSGFRKILVVGAGKAGAAMAKAIESILGDRVNGGLVIVQDGNRSPLKKLELAEAGHPVPDERGVEAAGRILSLLQDHANANTLVLCLISGGGSALMSLPASAIPLSAKQQTTGLLLRCGATVDEINIVRKHISKIKGGQLARAAFPAKLFSLILSDVIGDQIEVIASGPTVGDPSTFSDAVAVLKKHEVWEQTPTTVREFLEKGLRGEIPETPKPGERIFENVCNVIIGSNRTAVESASKRASSLGFHSLVLSTRICGEAREVGGIFASIAIESEISGYPIAPPACILAGGETTVTVRGEGKGGRNQELALSAAIRLAGARRIVVASVGTDGADGPTDAAGAVVDTTTLERAKRLELDPAQYLRNNDSYHLLAPIGDLVITGPTGTNVMDLIVALIG